MKKIKKYLGKKIRIMQDMNGYNNNILIEKNIIEDFEKFIQYAKSFYGNDIEIQLLEDNLTLYKCDIRKTDKLSDQCKIREIWKKGIFDYCNFFTKKEIEKLLKENYFVAIEGLQEIELEDLNKF